MISGVGSLQSFSSQSYQSAQATRSPAPSETAQPSQSAASQPEDSIQISFAGSDAFQTPDERLIGAVGGGPYSIPRWSPWP
jgi:hypothetical protein